jgi:hypothetical protein
VEDTLDYETASENSAPSMEDKEMYSEGSELSDWESDPDDLSQSVGGSPSRPVTRLSMPSGASYPMCTHVMLVAGSNTEFVCICVTDT